jgi:hypothetical protein
MQKEEMRSQETNHICGAAAWLQMMTGGLKEEERCKCLSVWLNE